MPGFWADRRTDAGRVGNILDKTPGRTGYVDARLSDAANKLKISALELDFVMSKYGGLNTEVGVFREHELEELSEFFHAYGFGILRGLFSREELSAITAQCIEAQKGVIAGTLDSKFGNSILLDDEVDKERRFTNYVQYITQLSQNTRAAILQPAIIELMEQWVPGGYLLERSRFGVVYQDARGGKNSGYRRIGWHSDWQSGPHRDVWPSVAFTINIDATSPANGFLRVVPGSHNWATPAPWKNANNVPVPAHARPTGGYTDQPPPYEMPLAFEKAPGEIAVYCEEGDVLFHDAYLWHSAAAGTADRSIRRHIRGGWYSGVPDAEEGDYLEDFIKNAAR